jgi:hypothetical protein
MDYVHHPLGTEVTAIGGYYTLVKEGRLGHRDRELFYLVGHAAFETSCCGVGGCAYAIVPGYIVTWKSHSNPEGLPISRVTPVEEPSDQETIRQHLLASEWIHHVIFM